MLWIEVYDLIVGFGVVILQIITLSLVVLRVLYARGYVQHIGNWIAQYGIPVAFMISLLASVGSMIYSNVAHLQPCILCWWQRIFLFPQVIILGIATATRDWHTIKKYLLWLSGIGLVIAVYHYAIQHSTTLSESAVCNALEASGSCSEFLVNMFGYITIPMMSLTVFLFIIVVLSFKQK